MEKESKDKKKYITAAALSCIGCLMMMVFPSISLNAAQKGITLWASSVLPALLPFFICANFMTALGFPMVIGNILEHPFQKMFKVPGISGFIFTISIISGYPMGAKLIGDFGRKGMITQNEAKRMLAFCSTSGPLFMLGAVGTGMLASPAAGALIACSHYLGALLNGFLFRIILPESAGSVPMKPTVTNLKKEHLLDVLTDSMLASFRSLGIICGYIVLFMMLTSFIDASGFPGLIPDPAGRAVLDGVFEMTVGCSEAASLAHHSLLLQSVLCSFLISFGGLSVFAQSMSMLAGLKIPSRYYIAVKFTHGILAAAAAWLLGPMILNLSTLSVLAVNRPYPVNGMGYFYQLLFSSKMVIMVVILFFFTILTDKLIRRIHACFRNHSRI